MANLLLFHTIFIKEKPVALLDSNIVEVKNNDEDFLKEHLDYMREDGSQKKPIPEWAKYWKFTWNEKEFRYSFQPLSLMQWQQFHHPVHTRSDSTW